MKKLAILALALVLLPAVLAIVPGNYQPALQTTFILQGYEFARVQGVNNGAAATVPDWHFTVQLAQNYASCELQPTSLPSGAFTLDLVAQCQTRSGMTAFFKLGTRVALEAFFPEGTNPSNIVVDKIWLESRPESPQPFLVGHVISENIPGRASAYRRHYRARPTGGAMFILGIGAIAALTIAVLLASRKEQ